MSPAPAEQRPGGAGEVARRADAAIKAARRVLRSHERVEAARLLDDVLAEGLDAPPRLVVAGEVARGKSSLVNALLGRPGLSPVGSAVTTAAFLGFVPPRAGLEAGQAELWFADGERRRARPEDVLARITAPHRGATADGALLRGGEIALESDRLPGVSLVDTPGVGGLDGGHAALAAWMASTADLLLLVADAGQRLTATELEFLGRCAERAGAVVVVLAKTDRHPRGWREVREEDAGLLRRQAPGVPCLGVLGVSSLLAEKALGADDPQLAERLLDASGVPALLDAVRAHLADRRALARGRALAVARAGLEELLVARRGARDAMAGHPEAVTSLEEERDGLQELLRHQARWPHDLDRDLTRLRNDTSEVLAERLRELRQRWTQRVNDRVLTPRGQAAAELASEVTSELQAVLAEVDRDFRERLGGIVASMYEDAALAREVMGGLDGAPSPAPRATSAPLSPSRRGALALLVPAGVAGGAGFLARLGLGGAAVGVAGSLSLLPLVLVPLLMGGVRGLMTAGRAELVMWLNSEVDAARLSATNAVTNTVADLKPELVLHYRAHLAQRVEDLRATLRRADRAQADGAQSRQELLAEADRELAEVGVALDAVTAALGELRPVVGP